MILSAESSVVHKSVDIEKIRSETPACQDVIHFNNAGASLMPEPVFRVVLDYLHLEQKIGGYEAGDKEQAKIDSFYTSIARMLSAKPSEIAFMENATRAWDMAFYALPLKEGDRILTHKSEYGSNFLAYLQLARRRGIEIDIVPSDEYGQIDVDAIEGLITSKTKAISITHVPMHNGMINPVAEVGKISREHGLYYVLDSCQAAGQVYIDVGEIGCDILSATGRKYMRGPRGTGFLYISDRLSEKLDPPFIDIQAASWTGPYSYELAEGARKFETWEGNVAGKIGLAAASEYAQNIGLPVIEEYIGQLASCFREQLSSIENIRVCDQGKRQSGIVTFFHKQISTEQIKKELREKGMNVSLLRRDHSWLDLGDKETGGRDIEGMIRASVHYYNTEDEVTAFCDVLKKM